MGLNGWTSMEKARFEQWDWQAKIMFGQKNPAIQHDEWWHQALQPVTYRACIHDMSAEACHPQSIDLDWACESTNTGWWFEPLWKIWKYESQLGVWFPIYGKINVPNHQTGSVKTAVSCHCSIWCMFTWTAKSCPWCQRRMQTWERILSGT